MWPKAFAQLIELAPHISRLLPMADRFFQSKTATDDSTRKAMDAMAEGLRGDLGQVTAAHAGLYKQIIDVREQIAGLGDQLTQTGADARAAKAAAEDLTEALQARLTRIEARQRTANTLLATTLVLLLAVLVLVILLFLHAR